MKTSVAGRSASTWPLAVVMAKPMGGVYSTPSEPEDAVVAQEIAEANDRIRRKMKQVEEFTKPVSLSTNRATESELKQLRRGSAFVAADGDKQCQVIEMLNNGWTWDAQSARNHVLALLMAEKECYEMLGHFLAPPKHCFPMVVTKDREIKADPQVRGEWESAECHHESESAASCWECEAAKIGEWMVLTAQLIHSNDEKLMGFLTGSAERGTRHFEALGCASDALLPYSKVIRTVLASKSPEDALSLMNHPESFELHPKAWW